MDRRRFVAGSAAWCFARSASALADPVALYRTPYKYPELVLRGTGNKRDFDGISVDDPIVFREGGRFYMLYIGFDGTGYQTGLASSDDLLRWTRVALVGPRDPASKYTKYNLAISSILRDKNLHGRGEALKVRGEYLAAWNAYPSAGYEEGAAVIGLARSRELALLGDRLPAEKAQAWGLIHKAVDDEIVVDEALMLALRLSRGPKAMALTRKLFWESSSHTFEEQLKQEQAAQRAAGNTQDFREGLAAFFEKRDPQFKGE